MYINMGRKLLGAMISPGVSLVMLMLPASPPLKAASVPVFGDIGGSPGFGCNGVFCWQTSLPGVGTTKVTASVSVDCCLVPYGSGQKGLIFHGYTLGPARPGIMTLSYFADYDAGGYVSGGSIGSLDSLDPFIPSLYSWSCTGCAGSIQLPMQLGTSFNVNLSAWINVRPGYPLGSGGFVLTGAAISMSDVPEPSSFALISVGLLAACSLLRRHRRA